MSGVPVMVTMVGLVVVVLAAYTLSKYVGRWRAHVAAVTAATDRARAMLSTTRRASIERAAVERAVADSAELAGLLSTTVDTVLSIATAAEQLSASSAEIATCASEATRVSGDAVHLVVDATGHIDAMTKGSEETARITGVIHALAERTQHYQAAIAAAVEEQSVVTGDIARIAHQAEQHGGHVSRRLQQLAQDLAAADQLQLHSASREG